MSDHFQKHIERVKAEKGEKWAAEFDHEFDLFKLCSLLSASRGLAQLSLARASELSGVPEDIIEKIENEDGKIAPKYFDALTQFYTSCLAEKKSNRIARTNRLGALVASMSPQENQFSTFV